MAKRLVPVPVVFIFCGCGDRCFGHADTFYWPAMITIDGGPFSHLGKLHSIITDYSYFRSYAFDREDVALVSVYGAKKV